MTGTVSEGGGIRTRQVPALESPPLSPVDGSDKYHIHQRPPLTTGDKSGVRLLLRFSGIRRNLTHVGNFTQAAIVFNLNTHSGDQTLLMVVTHWHTGPGIP